MRQRTVESEFRPYCALFRLSERDKYPTLDIRSLDSDAPSLEFNQTKSIVRSESFCSADQMKFKLSTLLLIPALVAAFFGGRSAYRTYTEYRYVQEIKASAEIREEYLRK